jgi:hypothetical protein
VDGRQCNCASLEAGRGVVEKLDNCPFVGHRFSAVKQPKNGLTPQEPFFVRERLGLS